MTRRAADVAQSCTLLVFLAAAALSSRAQQTNPSISRDISRFSDVFNWNIFDPRRVGPRKFTPPPPVVDRFWLSGTMSYSKGLFAVFDGTQGNLHQVLETGGKIAGYTVTQIGQDSVSLTLGTNTLKLTMDEQMSHSQDGKWTLIQGSGGSSYSSSYGGDSSSSYMGNERGNRRRRGGRNEFDTGGPTEFSTPVESSSAPSTDTGGNDIISRMRRARAAAMGGGGAAPGNGSQPSGNQNTQPDNGPGQPDGSGPQIDQGPTTPPDGGPPVTPPDGTTPTTPPTGPGTPNGN